MFMKTNEMPLGKIPCVDVEENTTVKVLCVDLYEDKGGYQSGQAVKLGK